MRELAQGAQLPVGAAAAGRERRRRLPSGRRPTAWACNAAIDCELGLTLSHGGGYPGYGSHVLLLPDYGVGIFALANRTYAGPRAPVWDAAVALLRAGDADGAAGRRCRRRWPPPTPRSAAIFTAGSVTAAGDVLAMNFLMDRDAEHWAARSRRR